MTGLDTNILVQYALAAHPAFAATAGALNAEIKSGSVLAVTPSVLMEFLHIVTDTRRFSDALTMSEALDWVARFLSSAQSVQVVTASNDSLQQTLSWLKKHQLGRKRLLDTDLIATYQKAGCTRLLTSNPSDFAVFGVLQIICP